MAQYNKKFLDGEGLNTVWDVIKDRFTLYASDGIEIDDNHVKVLYDDKTLVLNSEGKLKTQIGGWLEHGYNTVKKYSMVADLSARGGSYHQFELTDDQRALFKSWVKHSEKDGHTDKVAMVHAYGYRGSAESPTPFDEWFTVHRESTVATEKGLSGESTTSTANVYFSVTGAGHIIFNTLPELYNGKLTFDFYLWEPCVINYMDGRFINIKDAIKLDSEGALFVDVDDETIIINSEGELEVVSADVAIDNKTIIKNSEGELKTAIGGWAEVYDPIAASTILDSEGATVSGNTVVFELDNDKALAFFECDKINFVLDVDFTIGGSVESKNISSQFVETTRGETAVDYECTVGMFDNPVTLHLDEAGSTLTIDTTGYGTVTAAIANSLTFEYSGEEIIHYVDNEFINVNGDTIVLDGDNKLKVNLDNSTLVIENNNIAVNYDKKTIVLNSEGKLSASSDVVLIDNKTIVRDSEDKICVPIDADTIYVSSEGIVCALKSYINDVDLSTNPNTEEAKITWYGTLDEWEALGAYDPYTLYVIDDSTSEGGVSPSTLLYDSLTGRPKINGITLSGNKTLSDLGLQGTLRNGTAMELENNVLNLKYRGSVLEVNAANELYADTYTREELDEMIANARTVIIEESMPEQKVANVIYYIGPNSEGKYAVWLCDRNKTLAYLGMSNTVSGQSLTEGDCITIQNAAINVNRSIAITSEGTDNQVPTTQAVYNMVMGGAGSSTAGKRGLVPDQAAGDNVKFLRGDGQWASPTLDTTGNVRWVRVTGEGSGDYAGTTIDFYYARMNNIVTVTYNLIVRCSLAGASYTCYLSMPDALKPITGMNQWHTPSGENIGVWLLTDGNVMLTSDKVTSTGVTVKGVFTYIAKDAFE